MLSERTIRNLIHLRLPETEVKEILMQLTPETIDVRSLGLFVDTLRETLDRPTRDLEGLENVLDCSGTGGSGLPHFNTSTAAAFVLAAGGLRVAKFGNRAATSLSGSFDLLTALGFPLGVEAERVPELLDDQGLVFLYAPSFYPVLARLSAVRRSLKEKTVFNFLGPLLNPVKPAFRVMGVPDPLMQAVIGRYLSSDNRTRRAFVVRSADGLDELQPDCDNTVVDIEGGESREFHLAGRLGDAGAPAPSPDAVPDELLEALPEALPDAPPAGPEENSEILKRIFSAADSSSVHYRSVCLNAAAGFVVAGISASIEDGAALASEIIASGAAERKLADLRRSYAACAS